MSKKNTKWIDGRMAQGAYIQWLVDTHPNLNSNIYKIIIIISRFTLGNRYKYNFINTLNFKMSTATKKRYMKQAKEIGLIDYERTFNKKNKKGYTKFWIILPKDIEEKILWKSEYYVNDNKNISNNKIDEDEHEDEGALSGW